jgi:hypothetical protein
MAAAEAEEQCQQLAAAGGLAAAAGCVDGGRVLSANPDPGVMMRTVAALQQDVVAQERLQALQGIAAPLAADEQQQQQLLLAGSTHSSSAQISNLPHATDDTSRVDQASCGASPNAVAAAAAAYTRASGFGLPGSPAAAAGTAANAAVGSSSSAAFRAAMAQLQGDALVPWFNPSMTAAAGPAASAAALFDYTTYGTTESLSAACDPGASVFGSASSISACWANGNGLASCTMEEPCIPAATCSFASQANAADWQQVQMQMRAQAQQLTAQPGSTGAQLMQQQQWQVPAGAAAGTSMQADTVASSMPLLPAVSSALFDSYRPNANPAGTTPAVNANVPAAGCGLSSLMAGGQMQLPQPEDSIDAITAIDVAINQQLSKLVAMRRGIAVQAVHCSSSSSSSSSGPNMSCAAAPAAGVTTAPAWYQPRQEQNITAAVAVDADVAHMPRLMLAAQAALRAAGCDDCSCPVRLAPVGVPQAGRQAPMQLQQPSVSGAVNPNGLATDGSLNGQCVQVGGSAFSGSVLGSAPQFQQQVDPAGRNNLQQLLAMQQQELRLQQQMSLLGL